MKMEFFYIVTTQTSHLTIHLVLGLISLAMLIWPNSFTFLL